MNGIARFTKHENGRIVDSRTVANFITIAGEKLLADRLTDRDDADGDISHMAVGTSSGQTRASTTLATELARVALDVGYPDQGATVENQMEFWATFPAGTGTGTWTEAGLFNDATTGTMVNYYEFDPPIDKTASQSITVKIYINCGVGE